jgi:hypothetical protein
MTKWKLVRDLLTNDCLHICLKVKYACNKINIQVFAQTEGERYTKVNYQQRQTCCNQMSFRLCISLSLPVFHAVYKICHLEVQEFVLHFKT